MVAGGEVGRGDVLEVGLSVCSVLCICIYSSVCVCACVCVLCMYASVRVHMHTSGNVCM